MLATVELITRRDLQFSKKNSEEAGERTYPHIERIGKKRQEFA